MKNKLFWVMGSLAITLGLVISSCGTSASAVKTYTFAGVQILNDPFMTASEQGAKAEAKKLSKEYHVKINILWTGPGAATDVSEQIADVESMIARHVNGIFLSPSDATALVPPVERAVAAHIPVVLWNSTLADNYDNKLAINTVISNNYYGGVAGGKEMCKAIGGKGDVAIIEAVTGIPVLNQRWDGFMKGIQEDCPAVKIVAQEITGNSVSKAAADTESLLVKYPNMAGFFADDIVNADGVVRGLIASHAINRVKVVAFDAEPEEVQLLQRGEIYALVAQKPYLMGVDSVLYLWRYLHHESVPKFTNVGYVLMTKSNLPQTIKWEY